MKQADYPQHSRVFFHSHPQLVDEAMNHETSLPVT